MDWIGLSWIGFDWIGLHNYIPLCLNLKFQNVLMRSSEHTNLQVRKRLKLQPGLISITDVGWVKPEVPLLE